MTPRSRFAALLATGLAVTPALLATATAGRHALSWHGLGTLAGFAAAGLFAVSLMLMLRLRWLDRAFGGLGQLYQAHHVVGTAAFLLLLVHPLALALGALQTSGRRALHLLWPDPSSALVLSGWLALLGFVAFFLATLARHLRYDLWRRLHRASVLAYGLMLWHLVEAWSGSLAAGVTVGLALAGVLSLAHRFLVEEPLGRGLRYRVAEVHHRSPQVIDLVLEPLGEPLRFSAGQFVYVALVDAPTYRACGERHPYTITSRPDGASLHLSIKALGDCTRHIQEVSPGVAALVQGPFGGLFPAHTSARPQVWIAGGVGVTPFLSAAASLAAQGPPVDLVYAATSEGAALYLEDLGALTSQHERLRVHTLFEDVDGRPTVEAIEARVGALEDREFMLAGPPEMVRALREGLTARGISAAAVHSEEGVLR